MIAGNENVYRAFDGMMVAYTQAHLLTITQHMQIDFRLHKIET